MHGNNQTQGNVEFKDQDTMTGVSFCLALKQQTLRFPSNALGSLLDVHNKTTLPADELSIMKNSHLFWRKRSPCVARLPSQ